MSLKSFTQAYIEAALWSSSDEHGTPLDRLDTELDADARERMELDAADFWTSNAELWEGTEMSDEQAGHDFWLTRNRHGAGFWDRGLGPIGKELTGRAHAFGEADLYVTDTGDIAHS